MVFKKRNVNLEQFHECVTIKKNKNYFDSDIRRPLVDSL